jgi:hypothetical protein
MIAVVGTNWPYARNFDMVMYGVNYLLVRRHKNGEETPLYINVLKQHRNDSKRGPSTLKYRHNTKCCVCGKGK